MSPSDPINYLPKSLQAGGPLAVWLSPKELTASSFATSLQLEQKGKDRTSSSLAILMAMNLKRSTAC